MLSSSGARTKESCKRGMGTRAGTGGAWGHGAVTVLCRGDIQLPKQDAPKSFPL